MRFFLVITIWVVIVGGLSGYISHRDGKRARAVAPPPVDRALEKQLSLELTPTFSTEQDPFALTTTEAPAAPLQVKLNGNEVVLNTGELLRGQTLRIDDVAGVLSGQNEVYISASPPLSEADFEHGVRLKVIDAGAVIVDETIWAARGALVSGSISFNLTATAEDGHDH